MASCFAIFSGRAPVTTFCCRGSARKCDGAANVRNGSVAARQLRVESGRALEPREGGYRPESRREPFDPLATTSRPAMEPEVRITMMAKIAGGARRGNLRRWVKRPNDRGPSRACRQAPGRAHHGRSNKATD